MINLQAYLDNPSRCPQCHGEHIDTESEIEWGEDGEGIQKVVCFECHFRWKDILKVVGIQGMPRPVITFHAAPSGRWVSPASMTYDEFLGAVQGTGEPPVNRNFTLRETDRLYLDWNGTETRVTPNTVPTEETQRPEATPDEPY
jgi:hypothetical protein